MHRPRRKNKAQPEVHIVAMKLVYIRDMHMFISYFAFIRFN